MKLGPVILLVLAATCFTLVLSDQLSSGDLYPQASTLRTDREGASAYMEALERIRPGVIRNYVPLPGAVFPKSTVLLLGVGTRALEETSFTEAMSQLATTGSRVVVSLNPGGNVKPPNWDLGIKPVSSGKGDDSDEDETPLWPVYFQVSPKWRVVREFAGHPIIVERTFGSGSIALVASTRPFLNLTLRDERDIGLLEWAAGDLPHVVFDEQHLGSTQGGTVMGLMRRLRLQGFLAVLIAASLLFCWRSSAPFPPVRESGGNDRRLSGAGATEALRNLLERRIPPSAVIPACVAEWTRDFARRFEPQVVQQVSDLAAAKVPPPELWEKIRVIIRGAKRHA